MARIMNRPTITPKMKLEALQAWAHIVCAQCAVFFCLDEVEFDHHLALIDGGKHEADNLRPLCLSCHRIKSAREHRENAKTKRIIAKRAGRKSAQRWLNSFTSRTIASRPFPKRKQ